MADLKCGSGYCPKCLYEHPVGGACIQPLSQEQLDDCYGQGLPPGGPKKTTTEYQRGRKDAFEEAAKCADRVAVPSERKDAMKGDIGTGIIIAATTIAQAIRSVASQEMKKS